MVKYIDVKDDNSAKEFKNVRDNGQWLVLFYATWCGHCQAMKPEWNKLINNNDTSVKLAQVESEYIDKNRDEVHGYPTLKLFTNGKVTEYNSGRDLDSFKTFLKNNEVKPSRTLSISRRPSSRRRSSRRRPSSRNLFIQVVFCINLDRLLFGAMD